MEEIKVGEYIRTKDGIIDRIVIAENDDEMYAGERDPEYLDYVREDIIKHSSNIIDLVEVGDYVNGNTIIRINEDPFIKGQINLWIGLYEMNSNGDRWRIKYTNNEIKSIVTKEAMKSVEYNLDN